MGSVLGLLAPERPAATRTEKETATTRASEKGTGTTDREGGAGKASEKAGGSERESARPMKPNKVYDQCGAEDDEDEWEDWEGPQRIKTSLAAPELIAKLRAILDRIFSKESLNGERVMFHPQDVVDVIRAAEEYLKSEPMLIEDVPFGITIVGDLNGKLPDLYRIFDCNARNGQPGYECAKYLFLGNYVDSGRQSLDVVMALFCLKTLHPDNFFLLRGNHEFARVNLKEGLLHEMLDRYEEKTALALFHAINETFCWLSVAAIVGNVYLCAHGGLSPRMTRNQLRGTLKPFIDYQKDSLVQDLVWAEPAVGLGGTAFNRQCDTSLLFGLDACANELRRMCCLALFRGNNKPVERGFSNHWNLCFSVFSGTAMGVGFNRGAYVDIDSNGKMHVNILEVDMKSAERDHRLFGKKDNKKRTGGQAKMREECQVQVNPKPSLKIGMVKEE